MAKNTSEAKSVISFRASTDADFDFVFNLNKTNMRKYVEGIRGWDEEWERTDMKTKFTPGTDQIIQIDGKDAGVFRILENDDSIKLDHIELLPEFQGRGIGGRIIGDLLAKGKRVDLQVLKQNPATELYKKLGFKVIGENDLKYLMSTESPD
jgi:ribosomal protein S18 acetylase RimI-like enzyme